MAHWIVKVVDTRQSPFEEIQSSYFDGTMTEAKKYFRKLKPVAAYWGKPGYYISMQQNPIPLWDGYESYAKNPVRKKRAKKNPVPHSLRQSPVKGEGIFLVWNTRVKKYWTGKSNFSANASEAKSYTTWRKARNAAGRLYKTGKYQGVLFVAELVATNPRKKNPVNGENVLQGPVDELTLYANNLGPSGHGDELQVYHIRQEYGRNVKAGAGRRILDLLALDATKVAARSYTKIFMGSDNVRAFFPAATIKSAAQNLAWHWDEEFSYGKNPTNRFTAKQLSQMRKSFSGINKIDPASPTYKKMIRYIDGLPQVLIKQIAAARIKFLSGLARNRIKGKG